MQAWLSQFTSVGARCLTRALRLNAFAILFICALVASAQVAVVPNVTPYGFQVLPGSNREIATNITVAGVQCSAPANQCTVNWSVLSTTGGASATFSTPTQSDVSSVSAGLATVQVNIGPTAGNCTISGAMGSYAVNSTATVTVQAQSVDDATKTGNFVFDVCAKTTTVMVVPAYQQAYQGQHRTLQSFISGDTDESGTWSITNQPSGGNGVLADTTFRDADFVATVTGRYTLEYISTSNPAKNATAIVYVSPNPMPTYATTSTPNKTEPRECWVDPQLTGVDYEVGPGKQYASLQATATESSLTPGSIIRVWNTDTSGSNPTTYHEYYQIGVNGTAAQPIILCGVPDSLGNLPVIDGANATTQSVTQNNGAVAGAGIISLFPFGGHYNYWQSGSAGPKYITVTGLHIAHGTPDYSYTPPGGGALTPYIIFTACLNVRSGAYIDLGGNHLDTCGLGVYSDDNGNNGWATVSQLLTVTGNHIQHAGISGQNGEHGFYLQTWYALAQGNLLDYYNQQAAGSAIKWRGIEGIFRYNNLGVGGAVQRDFDMVEIQDATPYIDFGAGGYLSTPGDLNCNDSFYCLGDTMGANVLAGYQESNQKDLIYGNEIFGLSALQQIHYLADCGGGMADRDGTLYFYSNTLDTAQIIFDPGSNGNGFNGYYPPRIDARNNIFWTNHAPYNGGNIQLAFGSISTIILNAETNLITAGTFTISPPILGAPWSNNTEAGWSNSCDGTCYWPLSVPLDTHQYGLSAANYLTTATQPYTAATMIPITGSPAIGTGTALTGFPALNPVRWQFNMTTNSLVARGDPLTIGAADETGGVPVTATPTFNPTAGTYTSTQSVSISDATGGALIYYTTDGSTPTDPPSGTTQQYSSAITVSATETVNAIAVAASHTQSPVAPALYTINLPMAATPTYSLAAGNYPTAQLVTISDTTPGAVIYYTTDGSTPTTNSAVYSSAINVNSTSETLNAIAAASGYQNSSEASALYTIGPLAATPTFSPTGGTFTTIQTVTISDSTPGATIYYTTNGSTPTTGSAVYSTPLTVSASETVKAVANASTYVLSATGSAAFTINLPTAGTPIFSPPAGSYLVAQTVSIATPTQGAVIYFTTNGTTPSTSSPVYSTPVTVSATETLEAIAVLTGDLNSAVGSAPYTIGGGGAAPVYVQACANLTRNAGSVACSLTAVGTGHALMIGVDGTTPTSVTYKIGTGSNVAVPAAVVSNAGSGGLGPIFGYVLPNTTAGNYTITANYSGFATVGLTVSEFSNTTASPVDATSNNSASTYVTNIVSPSFTTTSGSDMLWALCGGAGSVPTPETTPVAFTALPAISGIAVLAEDGVAGAPGSYTATCKNAAANPWYIITVALTGYTMPIAATPSFSPGTGTYSAAQTVTISSTTPSAAIYYTTDGSTPTTSSMLYSGPVTVSATETINALATASGYTNSSVGDAEFVISSQTQAATPTFNPAAGTYTGSQLVTISDSSSGTTIYFTTNGTTPTTSSAVYSSPITVSASETVEAIASGGSYSSSPVGSAAYTLVVATPTFNPGAGTYTTIQTVTISDATTGAAIYYTTNGTTPTTSSSVYSGAITVSASQTLEAIATAAGLNTSGTGSAIYTINLPTAATPTFNPAAGNYSTAQAVTISDTTPGATIYYTTDGTTPTTSSATYSSAITVSANETLEAMVTAYNYLQSATGSAVYTIQAATPTFSPAGGTYTAIQTVSISDGTSGATIYYTTNGTTPSTSSSVYSGAITVSATETLEAIAIAANYSQSPTGSAAYTINLPTAATPTFNPAAGNYSTVQTVTISDTTPGATIYFTTNGTTPSTSSPTYSSAITVSTNETLEAIAVAYNYLNSATGSAVYTIQAATPTFSPAGGTYSLAQTVSISDTTTGATIYYTTNGTTPTTSSSVYSNGIAVSASETLEAIAIAANYSQSPTGSAAYVINTNPGYVQQCSNFSPSGASGGNAHCTLTGVTAGDTLVIGVQNTASTIPTFTTSAGTLTPVISNLADTPATLYLTAAMVANAPSGSITITAKDSSTYNTVWLSVTEYTNVPASPLDTSADKVLSGGYGATSIATPSFNTTANNDMLWTMCAGLGGGYANWFAGTVPITWTAVNSNTVGTAVTALVEDGLAGSAGSYTGQCQTNTASPNQGGADDAAIITIALK